MYQPSKKTLYLVMAFASLGALGTTYAYWEDISFAFCQKFMPQANAGEVRLEDDQGNRYTLLNHGDGKETALYDHKHSVTFHRDGEGSLVWDAGLAGLIPSLASGYYAFHGFANPVAHMEASSMTYRIKPPLEAYTEKTVVSGHSRSIAHGIAHSGRSGRSDAEEYDKKSSKRVSFVGRKTGFGSAGARSSSAS